ncbi:hypothetical protein MKW94_021046 [Papaver nudicaule]|uniref:Uncharacterized protein n=1 Tax=Papaver nudicaule TaxID=74823 RepID=A0AA41SBS7_PAPNU|nr:hypothetical protein [Papaver nudicaule]
MRSGESEAESQHLGLHEENSTTRCSVGSGDHGEKECAQTASHKGISCHYESLRSEMNGGTHEAHVAPTFQENKDAHVSGTVEICNNKDENISPQRICHSGVREGLQVSTGNRIERCLRKPFSDQKGEADDSGSEKDDTLLSSTAKRRRYSKNVTSDGEEDDPTLLGELQEKVFEELPVIPELEFSPMNLCAWNSSNVFLYYGGQNVEEFVSPSRQRQVSPRKHEEKKSQVAETLKNVKDILLASNNLEMSVSSAQVKIGNLTSENDEEKVAQEAGSESESDSMGGHFEKRVDSGDCSSDSEEAVENGSETKWQNEAAMLSSFEKDPVLCMKAVCALHMQQTDEAKSIKGPFSLFSALRFAYTSSSHSYLRFIYSIQYTLDVCWLP